MPTSQLAPMTVHLWKSRELPAEGVSSLEACQPLLKFYLGDNHQIKRNENGKPIVYKEDDQVHPIQFNISHTKDAFVIAFVEGHHVGIDIESSKSERPLSKLAQRFFAPAEIEILLHLSEEDKKNIFFKLWTLKEAMIKCLGVSLFTGLPRARFNAASPAIALLNPSAEDEQLKFYHSKDTHYFSMALTPFAKETDAVIS
jgi:4'-phosphopantetheinyl transferase